MQVPNLHTLFEQVVREILGHFLGQSGDEYTFVVGDAPFHHFHQIVDLPFGRPNHNFRVNEAGRSNDLLNDLAGHAQFVLTRCGRQEDALVNAPEHFFERERTVVARRGQAKTMLNEHVFAAAVPGKLSMELGYSDVAFVNHKEIVVGKIVKQREWWLAVFTAINVHRVILDAVAVAELAHHLKVVRRSHPEPLCLEQFVRLLKFLKSDLKLMFDLAHRPRHALVASDIVGCRKHVSAFQLTQILSCQRIDHGNAVDSVAEHLDPQHVFLVRRVDLNRVATHPKVATAECHVVAVILHVDQAAQNVAHVVVDTDIQVEQVAFVLLRVAHAVNARDRGNDNDVLAGEERRSGRVAQPLDVIVD